MTRPFRKHSPLRSNTFLNNSFPTHALALLLTGLGLLAPSVASAGASTGTSAGTSAESVRTLEQAVPLEDARGIKISTQVGRIEVTGRGGWSDDIRVDIEVYCDSDNRSACERAADAVELQWRRRDGHLQLMTRGSTQLRAHHIRIVTRVSVPEEADIEVRVGVGELVVEDVEGDIEARVQTGDIRMSLRAKHFGRAEVSSNFGEAALYVDGGRVEGSGFVHHGVEWSAGDGSSRVDASTGAGDVTVRLR